MEKILECCPVCRAKVRGDRTCARCGAELGLLIQVGEMAASLERAAVQALVAGDLDEAESALVQAARLRVSPFGQALLAFVAELRRQPVHYDPERAAEAGQATPGKLAGIKKFFTRFTGKRGDKT
ncbi:hypothetical protein SCOR_22360 [Sulfidibacter corallicola]|uniref:Uncharacterized protein n=1 Tax=Sulfidibacter corallicola TaxID=2818388 RepID=A0A8A4TS87_SULCO|nr:hypothetical protein [Sulfidibacter corallicola]QTD52839.1 hypothetical protein J3U87_10210 [Sulfidibacter corallicola]